MINETDGKIFIVDGFKSLQRERNGVYMKNAAKRQSKPHIVVIIHSQTSNKVSEVGMLDSTGINVCPARVKIKRGLSLAVLVFEKELCFTGGRKL